MILDSINWEKEVVFHDGIRCWNSVSSGYTVTKDFSYGEYTSTDFVVKIIRELLSLKNLEDFAATFTQGDNVESYVFNLEKILVFAEFFEKSGWGVWAIVSGHTPPLTNDLIELFDVVAPNGVGIFIDLDDGMIVACPSGLVLR